MGRLVTNVQASAVAGPTLGGRHPQPRRTQPTHQFTTAHQLRAGGLQRLVVFLGHVVVIALEATPRDTHPCSELVQLVQALVADEVAPAAATKPPARFVDQHAHGGARYARPPPCARRTYVGCVRDDERIVRTAWRSVAGGRAAHVAESVLARHREPHRRYHGIAHVAWVLRTVDELLPTVAAAADAAIAIRAAALFHDAVYDPHRGDNEEASAQLARRVLTEDLGWDTSATAEVARLIRSTAGHTLAPDAATTDPSAAVLLDADLGVLGASPQAYQAYVDGVRGEYAHVDADAWRVGRGAVLQSFLDRAWIYATPAMRTTCEVRARANLTAELATLAGRQ